MKQKSALKIGTLNGVEFWVHYSWIFVLLFLTWVVRGIVVSRQSDWSAAEQWGAGAIVAFILFGSAVFRQAAAAFTRERVGLKQRTVLFSIFGMASGEEEVYRRPGEEAAIAASGLAVTLVLAMFFFLFLGRATGGEPREQTFLTEILFYSAIINVGFTVFNALPGLPLDGGRLLHSLIWKRTGDFDLAMRWAAMAGVGIFGLLAVAGLFRMVMGDAVSGVWIVIIGGSLTASAWNIMKQVEAEKAQSTAINRYGPRGGGRTYPGTGNNPGPDGPYLPPLRGGAFQVVDGKIVPLVTGSGLTVEAVMHPTPIHAKASDTIQSVMDRIKKASKQQDVVPVFNASGVGGVFVVADAAKYPEKYWKTMSVSAALRSKLVGRAEVSEPIEMVLTRLRNMNYPFAVVRGPDGVVGVVSQRILEETVAGSPGSTPAGRLPEPSGE